MVRPVRPVSQVTRSPRAKPSARSPASSGSTAITRADGQRAFTATAMPLISPPPLTGTNTDATLGQVLDDLQTDGALPGDHPRRRRRVARRPLRFGPDPVDLGSSLRDVDEHDLRSERLGGRALHRRRLVRHHDRRLHAERREPLGRQPCAWLPDECVMTPRARSSSLSAVIALVAPRALNDPPTWRHSALRWSGDSRRPHDVATSGVRRTTPAIRAAATSTSAQGHQVGRCTHPLDPRPYGRMTPWAFGFAPLAGRLGWGRREEVGTR